MEIERVIVVDSIDREIGVAEKLEAHQLGLLHRACSVVLFNDRGEILLQQRSSEKYHSGGLWTNTCCTHPRPGENPLDAATRRLVEEMSIMANLTPEFTFQYRADVGSGLIEHEIDHVFVGRSNSNPDPDPQEVQNWRWATLESVRADLVGRPRAYTSWFPPLLARISDGAR